MNNVLSRNPSIKTIDDLSAYTHALAEHNYDMIVPMSRLRGLESGPNADAFLVAGALPGMDGSRAVQPTRHAVMQLFNLLKTGVGGPNGGPFMHDTVHQYFPGEMARLVNLMTTDQRFTTTHNGSRDRNLLIRSRGEINWLEGDDDPEQIRAFLSDQFVRLDTHTVVGILAQFADKLAYPERGEGMFDELINNAQSVYGPDAKLDITMPMPNGGISHDIIRPHVTPDGSSFIFRLGMRIGTPEGREYYPAVKVKTGDIGGMAVHILGGMYDAVCKNGAWRFVTTQENTQMRQEKGWSPKIYHRWGDMEQMEYQATHAISHALMTGTALVRKAREATYRKLPSAGEIVANMIAGLVSEERRQDALVQAGMGMEREFTVMGVVNAITAAAQTPGLDVDTADALEMAGGAALERVDLSATDDQIANFFQRVSMQKFVEVEAD